MTNCMCLPNVVRRLVALGFLAFFLAALAIVPSCSDVECQSSGVGCPCEKAYECGDLPPCHGWMCDGTCHLWPSDPGNQCIFDRSCFETGNCEIGICSADLQCVECVDDTRCSPGHTCEVGGVCSRCDDGAKNGDETDVDCGGSCPLCPGTCNVDGDCPDGYCWQGSCVSCHDGVQNGDETEVDCGGIGGHCARCAGVFCSVNNALCASNNCEDAVCCAKPCPLCYDCKPPLGECVPVDYRWEDFTNAVNPDVLCYGQYLCDGKGNCKLELGNPCSQGDECVSGACINGTCK